VFVDFLMHYAADQKFVAELDLKRITPAPTHYFGKDGDEQIVDLIFRCPLKHRRGEKRGKKGKGDLTAVIIFEHQSGGLKKIPQKIIKYIASIWDAEQKEGKPLSAPYFIVLRTGKRPHRGPLPGLADSLPKDRDGKPIGKIIELEYDIVDLPAWDFRKLVGGPVLRMALGILKKMAEDGGEDFGEALLPLQEIADEEQLVDIAKIVLPFAAKVFAIHNRPFDRAVASKAFQPIFKEKVEDMVMTIFDEKYLEGVAEGEAIGEARGVAIGEKNMLLKVLQAKFHKVPKKIENTIRAMTDTIALESLAVHVTNCDSLDEFAKTLK
jgi:hypothetical protein